jgi:hypothetical protein
MVNAIDLPTEADLAAGLSAEREHDLVNRLLFSLRRYSGSESSIPLELLYASLLSSKMKDDLYRLNPFIAVSSYAISGFCVMLMILTYRRKQTFRLVPNSWWPLFSKAIGLGTLTEHWESVLSCMHRYRCCKLTTVFTLEKLLLVNGRFYSPCTFSTLVLFRPVAKERIINHNIEDSSLLFGSNSLQLASPRLNCI